VEVLQAVTNAWQRDLRYRVSRAKARIKFMMDDYGPEGVRARLEEQLGRRLQDGVAPEPTADADHMGVHAQRQPGLSCIGVPVPPGGSAAACLRRSAICSGTSALTRGSPGSRTSSSATCRHGEPVR